MSIPVIPKVHTAGSDVIRLGFIGCGNRGTGACREALLTSPQMKLTAIGDLFEERLTRALSNLEKYEDTEERIDVPPEHQFTGFDAYAGVMATDCDAVILATPPHFRPIHYAAAVAAGKHVFMEKPFCVDATGYRSLIESNIVAKSKQLNVVVGLQRRHQQNYLEGIERLCSGEIGDVAMARVYFNVQNGARAGWLKPDGMGELEYQIRHWAVFCWLGGDFLVEQTCHEIDVANWAFDAHPQRAWGMGDRQVRRGPGDGDIWDRFAIEYEYSGGRRLFAQGRQMLGAWDHVSDNFTGTHGTMTIGTGAWGYGTATPRDLKSSSTRQSNPYQQEHIDWVAGITGAAPYRMEGDYGAASSMTAVLGRMAAYTGREVTWDEAVADTRHVAPSKYTWDATPPVHPDETGIYPSPKQGL